MNYHALRNEIRLQKSAGNSKAKIALNVLEQLIDAAQKYHALPQIAKDAAKQIQMQG
jgi:hypothetical protein